MTLLKHTSCGRGIAALQRALSGTAGSEINELPSAGARLLLPPATAPVNFNFSRFQWVETETEDGRYYRTEGGWVMLANAYIIQPFEFRADNLPNYSRLLLKIDFQVTDSVGWHLIVDKPQFYPPPCPRQYGSPVHATGYSFSFISPPYNFPSGDTGDCSHGNGSGYFYIGDDGRIGVVNGGFFHPNNWNFGHS